MVAAVSPGLPKYPTIFNQLKTVSMTCLMKIACRKVIFQVTTFHYAWPTYPYLPFFIWGQRISRVYTNNFHLTVASNETDWAMVLTFLFWCCGCSHSCWLCETITLIFLKEWQTSECYAYGSGTYTKWWHLFHDHKLLLPYSLWCSHDQSFPYPFFYLFYQPYNEMILTLQRNVSSLQRGILPWNVLCSM